MSYYAHSPKGDVGAQTYEAHIKGVQRRADRYLEDLAPFARHPAEALRAAVQQAACYHDLGKLDPLNQEVLSGKVAAERLPVPHQDAGTACLWNVENATALASAIAVFAHHAGLPDVAGNMEMHDFRNPTARERVDASLQTYLGIHEALIPPPAMNACDARVPGDACIFFRLLLSCLADADHSDTAIHYDPSLEDRPVISLKPALRLDALNRYVKGFVLKPGGDAARFALRGEMFRACRDAVLQADISACDSPVGTGKTLAIMANLLQQAVQRKLRRVFVILPFTNIIEQSVEEYRRCLVLPGENPEDVVAELHHRADFQSMSARQWTALWRAPIIVTTAVSFFETLASNRPAALRRLHELPGSAIFVDEAHAVLPVHLLPLAWRWINALSRDWSCYWVLASGSLTRFWRIEEIAADVGPVDVPDMLKPSLRERLHQYEQRRIEYRYHPEALTLEALADWLGSFEGPRLVIMNTIQNAAMLASYMRNDLGRQVEHLSTSLAATDRAATLRRLRARLQDPDDRDWTLVATSCVEAGVNLSFRHGFRELASLSSLLQAAGRVDREAQYQDAQMWSFTVVLDQRFNENKMLRAGAEVLRAYFERGIDISPSLCTEAITREIRQYGVKKDLDELLHYESSMAFEKVADNFRVIDSVKELVIVAPELIERIKYGKIDWRELQKGSVQIPRYRLDAYHTPQAADGLYLWNLAYDDFLGYMAGVMDYMKAKDGLLLM